MHDRVPPFSLDWALFLDVDGTLLSFADRPEKVLVRPELLQLLANLSRAMPLALVSGRQIAELDRLFAPLHLFAAGQHGGERRGGAGYERPLRSSASGVAIEKVRKALRGWADEHPLAFVEDKGLTIAVHYRRAPELGGEAGRLAQETARALGDGFTVVAGNMVFEVRPALSDKGQAIAEYMTEVPFRGHLPVFIGDDATDEDGFALVNNMSGHSIKVGAGTTAARWRLADVDAVLIFLREYARWRRQQSGVRGEGPITSS